MRSSRCLLGLVGAAVSILWSTMPPAAGPALVPSATGWLQPADGDPDVPAPPADTQRELAELAAIAAKRTHADVARARWWNVGGPAYRWNELAIDALLDDFVTLPLAARHLALLHAAIDDAVAVASAKQRVFRRPRPLDVDPAWTPVLAQPATGSYPSAFAAAAAAAGDVLGYLFPGRAKTFDTLAEEAARSRIVAGIEFPSDVAAGRAIGRAVAGLAIARGRADGSDAKWTGSVPGGEGRWRGQNPVAPAAATWRAWVLARPDELRPPAPPAHDSERVRADLAELKSIQRSPKMQHRAVYWEVFGGARAHALWNELARTKLLEYADAYDARVSSRVLAALNVAFADAAIACWDAKFHYWTIRPSQLDADVRTIFPPPNHPSYPAAHGCLSAAASSILAAAFPGDREALLARGREAGEARVWAGIHYRFDVDAGQELGRKVADRVLARAFAVAR